MFKTFTYCHSYHINVILKYLPHTEPNEEPNVFNVGM